MSEFMTRTVVLYGTIKKDGSKEWLEFYRATKSMLTEFGLEANYLGVVGDSFTSGKVTTLKRTEKKLINSLKNNESLTSLSLYTLPSDFEIAAFDYQAYIGRKVEGNHGYIIATFIKDSIDSSHMENLVQELKKYIDFMSGEVFDMLNVESPQIYVSKVNDESSFKSLRIIKKL